MIGMSFLASLLLLIISVVVSAILFFWLKIRIGKGTIGFIAEVCVGWFGACLGWILEHWCIKLWDVYIIPAILCSASLILILHVLFPLPKEEKKPLS